MSTLNGKVAIVSGSSAGIGAAIAQELSYQGARVVINYPFSSEKEKAEAVVSSLKGPAGSIIVEADLSSTTGPSKLVKAAVERFGTIDILVNNAGISAPLDIRHADLDECLNAWDTMACLNGRGTLLLTRAVLKHLVKQNSRIINICSTTSRNPEPGMSVYAGTKGMIESFTRCWARDLPREYGCTVNAVAPGSVATENVLSAPPQILGMLKKTSDDTPVAPRMADPSEVAWTVATLCDERAAWLNGLYIPVAGGSTLS